MNISDGSVIAIDTETTGLDAYHGCCPFAVSMCDENGDTWYCEWPVNPFTREVTPDPAELEFVRSIMENPSIVKVMHNGKFDCRMLEVNFGIRLLGKLEETLFAARVCRTDELNYKLKYLADRYCGVNQDDQDELQQQTIKCRRRGKALGYKIGDAVPEDYWLARHLDPESRLCETYAVQDVVRTMLLWLMYDRQALDAEGVREMYNMEMTLWHITMDLERRGVNIHLDKVERNLETCKNRIHTLHEEMVRLAGKEFNISSSPQLQKILFDERGLEPLVLTDKGSRSTGKKALKAYEDTDPFVKALAQCRIATKLVDTFFEKYPAYAVPDHIVKGGFCIHTELHGAGTRTGRFTSTNPNLQQTKRPGEDAPSEDDEFGQAEVRGVFGPRKGYRWYCIDYSNLEMILFASLAKEQKLLDAWNAGIDLHTATANSVWGGVGNERGVDEIRHDLGLPVNRRHEAREFLASFDWDIVKAQASFGSKRLRTRAKNLNFAKIFGGGYRAVMQFIGCSQQEAERFLRDYDTTFPGITPFIWALSNQARRDGYIRNPYGRKLDVPSEQAYKAVNYLVQSSAADLMKTAMITCDGFLKSTGLDAHLVLTIHDELVFEIREEHCYKWLLRGLCDLMKDHGGRFCVDLGVDCTRVMHSWDKKEKVAL